MPAGTENGLNRINSAEKYIKRYFADPDKEGTISDNRIQSLQIDRYQRLWITTWNGLNSYDSMEDRFRLDRPGSSSAQEILPRKTLYITQSQSGEYWVGTFGEGLCRFLPGSSCTTYTSRDGLPDNIIYGILEDHNGYLYISTNRGRFCTLPASLVFQVPKRAACISLLRVSFWRNWPLNCWHPEHMRNRM